MSTQKKEKNSIKKKLLTLILLPILVLGAMIVLFGMLLLNRSYAASIRDELASMTNVLTDCLNLTVRGDYSYEDNMLLKGDLNITDSTMLYRVKESSEIDTSIFWKDTRILTTLEDEYGVSAVGTKADPEVVEAVLERGENFYSEKLDINGVAYVGYYTPLENSDHTIVGMVFAGKNKELVYEKVFQTLAWFAVFSVIAVAIAILITSIFSNRMILDINLINQFLRTISEGNLTVELDERIKARNDELGTIGKYAATVRSDLKKMIETDPLTTLYNRRSCNNRLIALEKKEEEFSLVMCDIDHFKAINDTYGHAAGDYVLVTISKMIKENIKGCGFACRWGGEEFLLIYRLDGGETMEKVKRLQADIRAYEFQYEDKTLKITMTFGVETEEQSEPYEERIKKADDYLYSGKNNGRDQIVCG